MSRKKAVYIIGIITKRNYIQYLTSIDRSSRYTAWESYTKAVYFTLQEAREIANGLRANGYDAIIIREEGERIYYNRRIFDDGENNGTI